MSIQNSLLALLAFAAVTVSCSKQLDPTANDNLDWSKTSKITLGTVTMSEDTKATSVMARGTEFRLYAINSTTKEIIATQLYSITDDSGTPTLTGGGDAQISLPYGSVDIFLVSPVSLTVDDTTSYPIAEASKVTPRRGVDLVVSRTKVSIKGANTEITPNALEHKMVKVQVDILMMSDASEGPSSKASYQDAYMTKENHFIEVGNIGISGTFAFDDKGGTITSDNSNSSMRYFASDGVIKKTGGSTSTYGGEVGATFYITDYLMPVTDVKPKIKTTFGYFLRSTPIKDVPAHEFSGTTSATTTMASGTFVKLLADPIPGVVLICDTKVSSWDDGGTISQEPINNSSLLFSYSGEDAPIFINSKPYWPDRSGNGNHAEIIGNLIHDKINKCYYATSGGAYFKVPALGTVPEYTMEITAQVKAYAQNGVVNFGGNNGISINLPLNTAVVWRSGGEEFVGLEYGTVDKYIYNNVNTYAFTKGSSNTANIIVNGQLKSTTAPSFPTAHDALNGENKLWNATVDLNKPAVAGVGTHRIYGARMYKTYMNNAEGLKVLTKNHAAVISHLGVNAPIINSNQLDYVQNGLILNLKGTTAPIIDGTNTIWNDLSGYTNNLTGATASVKYNTEKKCYTGSMTFSKSLGIYKELTMEFVARITTAATPTGVYLDIIQFKPNEKSPLGRLGIYYFDFVNNALICEAPYDSDNLRIRIPYDSLVYTYDVLSQVSFSRLGSKLNVAHNGYPYSNFAANANPNTVNNLKNGTVGKSAIDLYAVRIYNRALSEFERQHNYLVDKQQYKILP